MGKLEVIAFGCTLLQGAGAGVYLFREISASPRAKQKGINSPLVLKHPVLPFMLIVGSFLTAGGGFWLVYHRPVLPPVTVMSVALSREASPGPQSSGGLNPKFPQPQKPYPAKSALPVPAQAKQTPIGGGNQQGGPGDCQANAIGGNATVTNSCNGRLPTPDRVISPDNYMRALQMLMHATGGATFKIVVYDDSPESTRLATRVETMFKTGNWTETSAIAYQQISVSNFVSPTTHGEGIHCSSGRTPIGAGKFGWEAMILAGVPCAGALGEYVIPTVMIHNKPYPTEPILPDFVVEIGSRLIPE